MSTNRRALYFMLLAVVAAFGAVLLTREAVQADRLREVGAGPVFETRPVVVAATALSPGMTLRMGDLAVVDLPVSIPLSGDFGSPSALEGRVVVRSVRQDEPLLASALAPEGRVGGLSALIQPRRRAIAVKVDPVVGVAGFITPRSQVDVIATIQLDGNLGRYTNVILQDITVLAIDQKLEQTGEGSPQLVNVVTLEVTPEQAQKLSHSTREGSLQLVLRNPSDEIQESLEGVSGKDVLALPGSAFGPDFVPPGADTVEVIRGAEVRQESIRQEWSREEPVPPQQVSRRPVGGVPAPDGGR